MMGRARNIGISPHYYTDAFAISVSGAGKQESESDDVCGEVEWNRNFVITKKRVNPDTHLTIVTDLLPA